MQNNFWIDWKRFEHLLPRSRYLERAHTLGRLVSDRYDMNQSVKDLLVAEKTKMVRKKKKQVFEARERTVDRTSPELNQDLMRPFKPRSI